MYFIMNLLFFVIIKTFKLLSIKVNQDQGWEIKMQIQQSLKFSAFSQNRDAELFLESKLRLISVHLYG